MLQRTCYPVQTKDRALIHVMRDEWFGTGSTPIGFLGPTKKTLCGQTARRNVCDIFTMRDVSCLECARRYENLTERS